MNALRWPIAALIAALAVVGAYIVLGGRNYAPASVASPCAPRHWHQVSGFSDLENEVALSALAGAACHLHVSEPALLLAFTSTSQLQRFGSRHGLSTLEIAAAVRAGVERAISDGQKAGAVNEVESLLLRTATQNLPLDQLMRLVRGVVG
jgi:hypothetical protein